MRVQRVFNLDTLAVKLRRILKPDKDAYIDYWELILLFRNLSWWACVDTIVNVLEVTIELEETNQKFAEVNFTQLFGNILGLQVRDYHQKECIWADASKVRVIVIANF